MVGQQLDNIPGSSVLHDDLIKLIVNWEKAHIKDSDDEYTLNEINNYFSLII